MLSFGMRLFPTGVISTMICPPCWACEEAKQLRRKPRISAIRAVRGAYFGLDFSKNSNVGLPSEQVGKASIIRKILLKRHLSRLTTPLLPLGEQDYTLLRP